MGTLEQILENIEQRQDFLLTSHARPDGDSVGSLLALGIFPRLSAAAIKPGPIARRRRTASNA